MAALEKRVDDLEGDVAEIREELAEGDTRFAVIGTKMEHLTDKVGALTSVLTWVGGSVGLGLLGVAGSALLWVIAHMGK